MKLDGAGVDCSKLDQVTGMQMDEKKLKKKAAAGDCLIV